MIRARIKAENPEANMRTYARTYRDFSWSGMEEAFTWHRTGRVNIVHEAVDRWADEAEKHARTALVFDTPDGPLTYTYDDLKEFSSCWSNLLSHQGLSRGDRLFIFLPSCPEIYLAMLGCARLGVIFSPLYATLGYDELEERIRDAKPKAILTHPDLAERLPVEAMEGVACTLYTQGPLPGRLPSEVLVPDRLADFPGKREPEWLSGDSPLYLIYTSGSTGPPKGVVHTHSDMVGYLSTARYVLDVREDTVIWTDGDPAWITGTVYSAFAPWLCGAATVIQGRPFSASNCYRTLEQHGVSVWYTTPMTIRRLMEAGEDLVGRYRLDRLRHIASVGEALTPELFYWIRRNLRLSPHDTWWMTECGMICLANFPSMDIKPGAMGKPVPGIEAAVLDPEGRRLPALTMGELALKAPWPALMADIWQDPKRYRAYFRFEGWFCTGDMALVDEEGFFYHQGRMDDLIKVGEKLIGPYEIERILLQHPAVKEAAVISKSTRPSVPHLKAFITVAKGVTPSGRLNQEIKAFVKANLSTETPLTEVAVLEALPKTKTGKLLRRMLRARELGLPGGDPTGMED